MPNATQQNEPIRLDVDRLVDRYAERLSQEIDRAIAYGSGEDLRAFNGTPNDIPDPMPAAANASPLRWHTLPANPEAVTRRVLAHETGHVVGLRETNERLQRVQRERDNRPVAGGECFKDY